MATEPNASLPWWVQAIAIVGLPGVLALLLLGDRLDMIPGVQSQARQARAELARLELLIREQSAVVRWTCHTLWVHAGEEKLARVCWQRLHDDRGRSDRDAD